MLFTAYKCDVTRNKVANVAVAVRKSLSRCLSVISIILTTVFLIPRLVIGKIAAGYTTMDRQHSTISQIPTRWTVAAWLRSREIPTLLVLG